MHTPARTYLFCAKVSSGLGKTPLVEFGCIHTAVACVCKVKRKAKQPRLTVRAQATNACTRLP